MMQVFRFSIFIISILIVQSAVGQRLILDKSSYEVNAGMVLEFQLKKQNELNFPTLFKMRTAPATATLNENTGIFSWKPTIEDIGIRGVIFNLVDTTGAILAEEIVTIQVKKNNIPPMVSINSVTVNDTPINLKGSEVQIKEKDNLHIRISVVDENPEKLFFSHYFNGDVNQREVANATVLYNSATNEIDLKFTPDEEQARKGFINWSVNAVDEYGSTGNLNLRMDIKNVDFPPVIINKPSRKNIKDDFTYVFRPRIENDDKDELIYAFENNDKINNINLDDKTGELTWKINSSEMEDEKVYQIKYIVAEALHPEHKDEVVLEVVWSETNKSPQLRTIPRWDVKEGVEHTYKIIAEDPNLDDELTYKIAGGSELDGLSIDSKTGILTFNPGYDFVTTQEGSVDVSVLVQVIDREGEIGTGQIPVKIYDRPNPEKVKRKLINLQNQLSVMIDKTREIKEKTEFVDSRLRARKRNTTIALSAVSLAGAVFAGLPPHTVLAKLAPGIVGVPAAYGIVNNLNKKEEGMVQKLRTESNDLYTILNHKKQRLDQYSDVSENDLSNDPEFISIINQYNKEEELLKLNSKLNDIKSNYELLKNQKRYNRLFKKYDRASLKN